MKLIVCTAAVLSCFFVYSFVCSFIYYSLYICSLCLFVCIWLFITTLTSSYFSAWPNHSARLAFAISEWLCSLFFHNYFLLMSLHFCIKSTIKIVVVCRGLEDFCRDLDDPWKDLEDLCKILKDLY